MRYYLAYLRDRPDSVVGALEDIAARPGAVLVHCAAGKDRTGVVVAMALAAVGVEREAIVADYVATASGSRDHGRACARRRPTGATSRHRPTSPASRAPSPRARARVLDERDGGPAGWLAEHGFDPLRCATVCSQLDKREHAATGSPCRDQLQRRDDAIAPRGGSSARFASWVSPYLPAPSRKWWTGNGGSKEWAAPASVPTVSHAEADDRRTSRPASARPRRPGRASAPPLRNASWSWARASQPVRRNSQPPGGQRAVLVLPAPGCRPA